MLDNKKPGHFQKPGQFLFDPPLISNSNVIPR